MKNLFITTILFAININAASAQLVVDKYSLSPRAGIPFSVPSFRPTLPGQVIALDVMPSAGAVANPDNGFAWIDACDKDILSVSGVTPVGCARVGVKADRVEFGTRSFDGAPVKDVVFIRNSSISGKFDATGFTIYAPNGSVMGKFDANGLTVYGTISAQSFNNIP